MDEFTDGLDHWITIRRLFWALWAVTSALVIGALLGYVSVIQVEGGLRIVDTILLALALFVHTAFFIILLRRLFSWLYPQLPVLLFFVDFGFALFALSVIRHTQPIF